MTGGGVLFLCPDITKRLSAYNEKVIGRQLSSARAPATPSQRDQRDQRDQRGGSSAQLAMYYAKCLPSSGPQAQPSSQLSSAHATRPAEPARTAPTAQPLGKFPRAVDVGRLGAAHPCGPYRFSLMASTTRAPAPTKFAMVSANIIVNAISPPMIIGRAPAPFYSADQLR